MRSLRHEDRAARARILANDHGAGDAGATVARPRPWRNAVLCLAGTLILTTSSANAAVISWIGGADDWFDGSKWSLGVPPGNLDDTQIDNGGSATADSGSAFYPGGGTLAETNDLNVGVRANPILLPPYGTGSLTLNAVGLSVGGDLHVGVTNAPSAVGLGSSDGSLATSGGVNNPGDVDVGGEAAFGLFVDGVGSGTATGTGSVAGNLTGMGSGGLIVGRTEGGGGADGTLTVNGDVADFTSLQVGVTGLGSTGNAVGGLDVGGTLSRTPGGGFISVGTVAGAGQSSGALSVTNGISGFASIGIGNGSADPNATGSTTGTLDVLAGGVHNGAPNGVSFEVGNTNAHGTAVGTANVTGDITGFGQIEVGNVRDNNSAGNATGNATVNGNLTGLGTGALRVARTEGGGDADGTLTVSGDVADFTSLQVGVTGLGSTGNAVGGLNVGGTLSRTPGGGFISVGTVAGAGQSSGALSVTNGISGFASIGIGNGSADPNATGSTTGTLDVLAGGVHNGAPNGVSFEVGNTNAHGTAVGTANVTGGITGFGFIEVGNVRGNNSTGTATGQLGVGGGPVTASSMRVGVSEGGIGIATGIVSLDHTLVTLDTGLTLGDGSTLQMAIDGNNRGVDYAAFDAATAALDGILEVLFSFDPLSAVYDLIVSDSINGITGDFDSVSIFGLGIGTTYSYGIEIANIGGTDVEVYRLRIGEMNGTTVPEPGALLLLIAGLSGVLVVRSRRSETR